MDDLIKNKFKDMKENFTNIKHDPLVTAATKILTGCTQLDEESYRTPRYPLVYKAMKTVEDLDQDELEEFFSSLSSYISNGDLSEIGDIFDDRLYDEVGAHLFRAAKTWKNRSKK
jgi:hypothetical protein